MKTSLVIVLIVLMAFSTLAVLNRACKSGQHAWCAPKSTVQRHIKTGTRQLRPPSLISIKLRAGRSGLELCGRGVRSEPLCWVTFSV